MGLIAFLIASGVWVVLALIATGAGLWMLLGHKALHKPFWFAMVVVSTIVTAAVAVKGPAYIFSLNPGWHGYFDALAFVVLFPFGFGVVASVLGGLGWTGTPSRWTTLMFAVGAGAFLAMLPAGMLGLFK